MSAVDKKSNGTVLKFLMVECGPTYFAPAAELNRKIYSLVQIDLAVLNQHLATRRVGAHTLAILCLLGLLELCVVLDVLQKELPIKAELPHVTTAQEHIQHDIQYRSEKRRDSPMFLPRNQILGTVTQTKR